jgi:hypothetical protein
MARDSLHNIPQQLPRQVLDRSQNSFLVTIPCLNEVSTVSAVIRKIPREIPGISKIDVVVRPTGLLVKQSRLAVASSDILETWV